MYVLLIAIGLVLYFYGARRAVSLVKGDIAALHSHPFYHGVALLAYAFLPALAILLASLAAQNYILMALLRDAFAPSLTALSPFQIEAILEAMKAKAQGDIIFQNHPLIDEGVRYYLSIKMQYGYFIFAFMVIAVLVGMLIFRKYQHPLLRARQIAERNFRVGLIIASVIAVLTTIGIFMSVAFESSLFFSEVPIADFLFGVNWSPQTALREDQVGSSGAFGALPLFAGTAMITLIAMCVAVPVGLMSAIYLSEYASPKMRAIGKPLLEFLAGVPTVVYGFFAALTVAPFIRENAEAIGFSASSESALAAGVVMGIMIIPFISSLSDDVINAVPQSLRDGSYGLGATQSETIKRVIIPAALPGIVSSFLLAISRAVGETMIVVMAAGQSANLTANILDAVTTVTVQIVALLTGDTEFDSVKTLSAFALGLVLFLVTLGLNIYALYVVKKYKEQYD